MKPDAQCDHEARGQLIKLATDPQHLVRLEQKPIELVVAEARSNVELLTGDLVGQEKPFKRITAAELSWSEIPQIVKDRAYRVHMFSEPGPLALATPAKPQKIDPFPRSLRRCGGVWPEPGPGRPSFLAGTRHPARIGWERYFSRPDSACPIEMP